MRLSDRLTWLYILFDVWLFHKAPQISEHLKGATLAHSR